MIFPIEILIVSAMRIPYQKLQAFLMVEAEVEVKKTDEEFKRVRDKIDRGRRRARDDLPAQEEKTVAEDKLPVHT
jgi:hypothetical protein